MRRILGLSIALCATALFTVVTVAEAGEINYVGSSTVGRFIRDAAEVYKEVNFNIDTKPESGGGERCAAEGSCELGGVARELKSEFAGKGIHKTLIGKDAIAVIVNESNPIKSLSKSQLRSIFTGKIKNWKELGGPDMAIKPFVVAEGSATRKVFRKVVLGGSDYSGVKVIKPDSRIVMLVDKNKGSVGTISFAFIKGRKGIRPLAVGSEEASVNNSSYPITRPLYLVTKGAPTGFVKNFLDWAVSPAGQKVVKQRFVGVR